jgi:hypothetical protein
MLLALTIVGGACGGGLDEGDRAAVKPQLDAPTSKADRADTDAAEPPLAQPPVCKNATPGSEEDVASEPSYRADYLRRWTNGRGCAVRFDVLMTRLVREGACGPEDDILMGTPLGATSASSVRIYGGKAASIDREAQLTPSAARTGYRQDAFELWMDASDETSLFLVSPDHVERWRLDTNPGGCA